MQNHLPSELWKSPENLRQHFEVPDLKGGKHQDRQEFWDFGTLDCQQVRLRAQDSGQHGQATGRDWESFGHDVKEDGRRQVHSRVERAHWRLLVDEGGDNENAGGRAGLGGPRTLAVDQHFWKPQPDRAAGQGNGPDCRHIQR